MSNTFSLANYDCFGFDLDNTLASYHEEVINDMQYRCLMEGLLKRGFPKPLFKGKLQLAARGLFLDLNTKHLLKLDGQCQVLRVWSGSTEVNQSKGEFWFLGQELINNNPRADAYVFADLSDTAVPAIITDLVDSGYDLSKVWNQIYDSLVEMFEPGGSYIKQLQDCPEEYIRHRPNLSIWLKSLSQTKKTFLLTGSRQPEAEVIATQALGKDWKDCFHKIIYNAGKPSFFTREEESQWISEKESSRGCWVNLRKTLECSRPLYFGDNILQDLLGAQSVSIDTVLVVPELTYHNSDTPWGGFLHDGDSRTIWSALAQKYALTVVPSINMLAYKPLDYNHTPIWE